MWSDYSPKTILRITSVNYTQKLKLQFHKKKKIFRIFFIIIKYDNIKILHLI